MSNPNIIQASGSTLTYIGGGSRKFYRVMVAGDIEVRQWGRIGTDGQYQIIEHSGVRAAEDSCEKQLRTKASKGYGARRDIAFRFDATMLGGLSDKSQGRALAAACDAAEANAQLGDELDDLLGMNDTVVWTDDDEPVNTQTMQTMQQVADRALSVVTLAATNSTDASVEYAKLRSEMDAVDEQYERCKGLLETIELMITAGGGA